MKFNSLENMENKKLVESFVAKMRKVYGEQENSPVLREATLVGCVSGLLILALTYPEQAKSVMNKLINHTKNSDTKQGEV